MILQEYIDTWKEYKARLEQAALAPHPIVDAFIEKIEHYMAHGSVPKEETWKKAASAYKSLWDDATIKLCNLNDAESKMHKENYDLLVARAYRKEIATIQLEEEAYKRMYLDAKSLHQVLEPEQLWGYERARRTGIPSHQLWS